MERTPRRDERYAFLRPKTASRDVGAQELETERLFPFAFGNGLESPTPGDPNGWDVDRFHTVPEGPSGPSHESDHLPERKLRQSQSTGMRIGPGVADLQIAGVHESETPVARRETRVVDELAPTMNA